MKLNLSALKNTALVLMVIAGAMLPANEGKAASSTKSPEDKGAAHTEYQAGLKPKGFLASHTTEIEFFAALSIVGVSVLIPDLIRKRKERAISKSAKSSSTEEVNQPHNSTSSQIHQLSSETSEQVDVPQIKEVKMRNQRKNRMDRNDRKRVA